MEINTAEFLAKLQALEPALAKKEIVEQFTSFIFTGEQVFAYNDEICISQPLATDFVGSIHASELLALLKRVTAEVVTITMAEDKPELRIKAGRSNCGIPLVADIETMLERLQSLNIPEKFSKLPDNFVTAASFCAITASTDATNPALTAVHIKDDIMEAADSFKVTRFKLNIPMKTELLVSAKALKLLTSFKVTRYGTSSSWVHFKSSNDEVFSCRTFERKYPKLDDIITVSGKKLVFPAGLEEAISRAEIFAKADIATDTVLDIEIGEGLMKVIGKGAGGWLRERIKLDTDDISAKFKIQPELLANMTKLLEVCHVSESKIALKGEDFTHVICLS